MKIMIIAIILLYGLSLLICCGLIKLICLCFGLAFSWKVAVGIWLVICFLKLFLFDSKSKE